MKRESVGMANLIREAREAGYGQEAIRLASWLVNGKSGISPELAHWLARRFGIKVVVQKGADSGQAPRKNPPAQTEKPVKRFRFNPFA